MLFREIFGDYCENHKKHDPTVKAECSIMLLQAVHDSTGFKGFVK
jgi:hypothetical protein